MREGDGRGAVLRERRADVVGHPGHLGQQPILSAFALTQNVAVSPPRASPPPPRPTHTHLSSDTPPFLQRFTDRTRVTDAPFHLCICSQVFAQERAGHGKPIGERIQSNPEARLPPLRGLGDSDAVESNIGNIVDRCGYREPSDRPAMDDVRSRSRRSTRTRRIGCLLFVPFCPLYFDVSIARERGRGSEMILSSRRCSSPLGDACVVACRVAADIGRSADTRCTSEMVLIICSDLSILIFMLHAQVCSVVGRVLRHIENPAENPLEAVAPAPRPQHAPAAAAAAASSSSSSSAAKAFPSTGKTDYSDPHRTLATAAMSNASSVASSAPVPPPRDHASAGE